VNEKSPTPVPDLENRLGRMKGILSLSALSVGLVKRFPWKGKRRCVL